MTSVAHTPAEGTSKSGFTRGELVNLALLVFAPATLVLHAVHPDWSAAVFACGCVAVIPLAGFMGKATEGLASRAGSGVGGLLNATFGNAAELILGLAALRAGHPEVVKASLTGAITGNLLLILGASMFAGGLRYKEQKFSARAAESGASLMLLAVIGLFVPALFHLVQRDASAPLMFRMSIGISVVLLALYAASLFFQFRTHPDHYAVEGDGGDEEEGEHWSIRKALVVLVLATAGVAVLSEVLVHAIEGATVQFGFTKTFVGVVILAIVGNAAEHSTAIIMAMKNRMNLSVSVAMESSKQIALFVAPFLVIVSGLLGMPMSLEFGAFEVGAVGMSVVAATLITLDGRSNWLEGAMLLGVYAILGVAFFFTP
jgi:Ca2+:H+ antiporter